MKITLGGQTIVHATADKNRNVQGMALEFRDLMYAAMRGLVLDMSPETMRDIRDRLQAVATGEAQALLDEILAIMDQPQAGQPNLYGRIPWEKHTAAWTKRKAKRWNGNRHKYFKASGKLAGYFSRYRQAIIQNRLGGVRIVLDEAELESRREKRRGNYTGNYQVGKTIAVPGEMLGARRGKDLRTILMGTLTLKIFPKASVGMFPGLASGRWTQVPDRPLFEQTFPGKNKFKLTSRGSRPSAVRRYAMETVQGTSAARAKMKNPQARVQSLFSQDPRPQRPFVTPLVQYWALTRIPRAIADALRDSVKNEQSFNDVYRSARASDAAVRKVLRP